MTDADKEMIENIIIMANRMRKKALKMALEAGKNGAHLGGGLSCIEILATLYGGIAKLDPKNPLWKDRDRILISKAHCVLAYYTALYERGFLKEEDLNNFEKNGSDMPGHPLRNLEKGIEYSGGSLGMALSVGVGMAIDAKQKKRNNKIFVLLGDGECEEGAIWEAMMSASHYKLNNLIGIIDRNHLQYDGTTEEVAGLDNFIERISSFGWDVQEVDGHNIKELWNILKNYDHKKPFMLIADTVKGKGISFMENNPKWHHSQLSLSQYEQAIKELDKENVEYAGNQ